MTRRSTVCSMACLLVLLVAASRLDADEGKAPDARDWTAEVKRIWSQNCSSCHTAPDTRYETDRGFLSQLMETT